MMKIYIGHLAIIEIWPQDLKFWDDGLFFLLEVMVTFRSNMLPVHILLILLLISSQSGLGSVIIKEYLYSASPATWYQAQSNCRWVSFHRRLLLLYQLQSFKPLMSAERSEFRSCRCSLNIFSLFMLKFELKKVWNGAFLDWRQHGSPVISLHYRARMRMRACVCVHRSEDYDLATIYSESDFNQVLVDGFYAWIGLRRRSSGWTWTDGQLNQMNNWGHDEPHNSDITTAIYSKNRK